ncbi:MAG: NupC/NupG family nucleoside CNT transporter [Pseudohongiellaceae bacterium]
MEIIVSLLGIAILLLIPYLLSENRRLINTRTVAGALLLQILIGALTLYSDTGIAILNYCSAAVGSVLENAQGGIEFVFGEVGTLEFGFIFAFQVLPIIVFFSSLVSLLYHIGLMGWIIKLVGGALGAILHTTKVESTSATANIFVGQTEAPLTIRPYLESMSHSELFSIMVGGLSTVAGSVLVGYSLLGVDMNFLIAASFMAAPGGILMAKLMIPEMAGESKEEQDFKIEIEKHTNAIEAAAVGATRGMQLAINVGAIVLAFVGLIALTNSLLEGLGNQFNIDNFSLEIILGYLFKPVAFMLGIPWSEAQLAGNLIGQKLVFNEFLAYATFTEEIENFDTKSQAIITFALCGFANFSSIGIILGGLGSMIPSRKSEIAQLGIKAVCAGFLANLMSAAIAGFFLSF